MFSKIIRRKFKKCCTVEDFLSVRKELEKYGRERFYRDMVSERVFKKKEIENFNNPFAQMLCGEKTEQFLEIGDFLLINSLHNKRHKFLTPKTFEWETFNVLTLNEKHVPLIKQMKNIGLNYVKKYNYEKYGLYFHCYPFNTVNTLHLHIVDLISEPQFGMKFNNLSIETVLKGLKGLKDKNIS